MRSSPLSTILTPSLQDVEDIVGHVLVYGAGGWQLEGDERLAGIFLGHQRRPAVLLGTTEDRNSTTTKNTTV